MSRTQLVRTLTDQAGPLRFPSHQSRHTRHILPPSFLLPSLAPPARRSRSKRWASTSFWNQSFPHSASYTPNVPFVPPVHSDASASTSSPLPVLAAQPAIPAGEMQQGSRKKERKERYLDSLMDKAGELSLRCSILDADGNWTAEEGRYKKAELCREYDLDPRDLRKLDSLTPNLVPLILTRRTCVLISMLHIRALIKPDRVIVFDTAGSIESEVQRRFKWHLERNIRSGLKAAVEEVRQGEEEEIGLSYEHRALESILVATSNALEEEMEYTRKLVQQLLLDLEDDINRDNLKKLLHYSRRIVGFQSRASYVKRAVDEVLESDEDLSAMYLTSRAQGRPRALHDHVQLELLFESFVKQVEEIVSEVDTTVANMNSTQEIAELMLDSGRNALLALDIKVSIATLGIGTGALIAGLFGMNLATQLEQHDYAFFIVTGGASFFAFVVYVFGMKVLRRVRRVALSGTSPRTFSQVVSSRSYDLQNAARMSSIPGKATVSHTSRGRIAQGVLWGMLGRLIHFRRGTSHQLRSSRRNEEPVWINSQADQARVRDAFRAQVMAQRTAQREGAKNRAKDLERSWKDAEDTWKTDRDPWCMATDLDGGWKWGKGRGKWAKE